MFIYTAAFMREDFTEREVQRHDFLVVFEIELRSWYVFVKPDDQAPWIALSARMNT